MRRLRPHPSVRAQRRDVVPQRRPRALLALVASAAVSTFAAHAGAFKPTLGYRVLATDQTHQSITENTVKQCQQEYFSISTPTASMNKATKAFVDGNASIDIGTGLFSEANHFDAESFTAAQGVLRTAFNDVIANLQANKAEKARTRLGNGLHTLQDFYAHSNWIEMGNGAPNPATFDPFPAFGGLAGAGAAVCNSCEGTSYFPVSCGLFFTCSQYPTTCSPQNATNTCNLNMIAPSPGLSSGYFALVANGKPAGKCSHGGPNDETGLETAPYGGINKDTGSCSESPHSYLHQSAAATAKLATKAFFDAVKAKVTQAQLKSLFGVGPTLAFAIDTTGSMQGIIDGVKTQVDSIIDERLAEDDPPSQYVLAPFSDPSVGPVTVTDDPDVFKAAVDALVADGGDDCPEYSQSGMLQALAEANPGGELFLFTDATSKDSGLSGNVSNLARSKEIEVNPILFGSCSPIDPGYIRAAKETGGQLFFLDPSEAFKITELAGFIVRSDKVNVLLIDDTLSGTPKSYSVPVDATMSSVTFSVSGVTDVTVQRPDGTTVQPGDLNVTSVALSTGKLLSVESPGSGAWTVTVNGEADFSLSVTGQSPLFVSRFDFVEQKGRPGHDGSFPIMGLPLLGETAHVHAALTPQFSTAQFELRTKAGVVLQTLALPRDTDSGENDFFGDAVLPDAKFNAYVTGLDGTGHPYQRIVPAVIRPSTVAVGAPAAAPIPAGLVTSFLFPVVNHGPGDTFKITTTDSTGYIQNVYLQGGPPPPPPPPPDACAHPMCESGAALDASCNACVTDICAVDPYCCNNFWDGICVGEVDSVCGTPCNEVNPALTVTLGSGESATIVVDVAPPADAPEGLQDTLTVSVESAVDADARNYAVLDTQVPGTINNDCTEIDADSDGSDACDDCDDNDPAVHPGATELCDGVDNDCDGEVDPVAACCGSVDSDGDGYTLCVDCDDTDPDVHPGAADVCNGVDDDCDGGEDYAQCCLVTDADGDGSNLCDDCDDEDPDVHPGAVELCDDKDNNCDGQCNEGLTGEPTCVTIQRGTFGDVEETDISEQAYNWAAGSYPFTWTGGSPMAHRSLYWFDVDSIPQTATVTSATFSVWVSWNMQDGAVRGHQILAPWDEATATWSSFGDAATFDPSVLGSFNGSGLGFKSIPITSLAQAWVSGAAPNHGLLLEEDLTANHNYFASEVSTVTRRPKLDVCFTNLCGVACGAP